MTHRDRLTLAAALAVALASSALSALYDSLQWAPRVLGAVLVVALVGLVWRRRALPAAALPLVQLFALLAYACLVFVPQSLAFGLVPTGRTVEAVGALVEVARRDVVQLAAPVPAKPGLVLLAVLGVGAIAVVVDLLAVGLRLAAAAGLPLLVLFAIPSGVLPGGLGWLPFTLTAVGWLVLLVVEGTDRVGRWGVPLRSEQPAASDPSTGRVGRRIGAAALGVSLVVPAAVPGLDAQLFASGSGDGSGGDGQRTTITYNPITRLRGDLNQPRPVELLRYTTDDAEPDYLRMTSLDIFDGSTWRSSSLTGDPVDEGIPSKAGVQAQAETRNVTSELDLARRLGTRWLPAPLTATDVEVEGPWRWDAASDTIYSTRRTTRDVDRYTVRSTRVLPDADLLRSAGAVVGLDREYTDPVEISREVRRLLDAVVGDTRDPYDQARALQRFFRSGAFRYEVAGPAFDDPNALDTFLLRQRVGFCEQFASSMAVLLRALDIPSRVGVGFTPGDLQDDGRTRLVTTADAHAWPEAYFAGAGWVRFEPTPAAHTEPPAYTGAQAGGGSADAPVPGASAAPGSTPEDGAEPTLDPRLAAQEDEEAAVDAAPLNEEDTGALPGLRVLAPLAVLALLLVPALVAAVRRRARWSRPSPQLAWQQVQDDAQDVGHRWRPADSPRAAAAHLVASRSLPTPAVEALGRVATAAERARYAPPSASRTDAGSRADATAVRRALLAGASGRARLQALLAPPSTLRWLASTTGGLIADLLDRTDDAVAALLRRLRRGRAPV